MVELFKDIITCCVLFAGTVVTLCVAAGMAYFFITGVCDDIKRKRSTE